MKVKWVLESFSIINFNSESLDYDRISADENLVGSFDYLGNEGLDNFLIDPINNEIVFIGLSVPQNFSLKDDFLENSGIEFSEYERDDLFSKLKKTTVFNEPSISIFDAKNNRLICLSSLKRKKYQTINVNNDFLLLFDDWEYQGFVLNNAFENINNYDEQKSDMQFESSLKDLLKLINENTYAQMENEDNLILQKLNELKGEISKVPDPRAKGFVDLIENYIFAYY